MQPSCSGYARAQLSWLEQGGDNAQVVGSIPVWDRCIFLHCRGFGPDDSLLALKQTAMEVKVTTKSLCCHWDLVTRLTVAGLQPLITKVNIPWAFKKKSWLQ